MPYCPFPTACGWPLGAMFVVVGVNVAPALFAEIRSGVLVVIPVTVTFT